jgi:uncharacterized membrane protein YfcA
MPGLSTEATSGAKGIIMISLLTIGIAGLHTAPNPSPVGPVDWSVALLVAVGSIVGGQIGS